MSSPSPSPSTSPGLIAAIAGAALLALVAVGTFLWSVVAEVTALTTPQDAGPIRVPPAPLPTARPDVAPARPLPTVQGLDASIGVDVVAHDAPEPGELRADHLQHRDGHRDALAARVFVPRAGRRGP